MIYVPIKVHPKYGFDIPTYNVREAVKKIAEAFVNKDARAKSTILRQALRPGMQYSSHVLVLGDTVALARVGAMLNVGKSGGDIGLANPEIKAWMSLEEDTPFVAHPLFIVRAEESLIGRINPFFEGFIDSANRQKERNHDDGK